MTYKRRETKTSRYSDTLFNALDALFPCVCIPQTIISAHKVKIALQHYDEKAAFLRPYLVSIHDR